MGGKSSSSSSSTSTSSTTTTTGSATGTVGDVFQGETISYSDYFPQDVADAFDKLIGLSEKSIDAALSTGQKAFDVTAQFGEKAASPDLTVVQGYQKQVYYIIGALAVVGLGYAIFRGKK